MDHALLDVGEPNRQPSSPTKAALISARAARVRGATSPLARTYDGAQAAKAKAERDRLNRLREADARERERLLAERKARATA